MDKLRCNKLMWRWSLLTAGSITLFWAVWYLINGNVPTVTQINLSDTHNKIIWTLPFGVSRWWDILFGVIWANLAILTIRLFQKLDQISTKLPFPLFFGPLVMLVFGTLFSLIFGLVTGLVFGLIINSVIFLSIILASGLAFGLALVTEFLFFGLGFIIKSVKSVKLFISISNWLMAK